MAKFKLQTVLDYRSRLEELAQQEHAVALQKEAALQRQVADARRELADYQAEFDDQQKKGILPQELIRYQNYLKYLSSRIEELVVARAKAQAEVEARLNVLCKASQEKRLLEKLKEKHFLSDQAQLRQAEATFLDEIAVQKFKRKL
ncbi:MAG: flagellar export protein FliJ [Desulfuromonadaceae bacterium]|jgi:flagellar protein FliJ